MGTAIPAFSNVHVIAIGVGETVERSAAFFKAPDLLGPSSGLVYLGVKQALRATFYRNLMVIYLRYGLPTDESHLQTHSLSIVIPTKIPLKVAKWQSGVPVEWPIRFGTGCPTSLIPSSGQT